MRRRTFVAVAGMVVIVGSGHLSAAGQRDTLVARLPWGVLSCGSVKEAVVQRDCESRTLTVDVVRPKDGNTRLVVWEQQAGTRKRLLESVRGDHFLGMMPLSVGGHLMTQWVGGSALKVLVLRYADGKVSAVLDVGTKSPPEVVQVSLEPEPAVVVAHWESDASGVHPLRASVYCWKGESYRRNGTFPWKDRFRKAIDSCRSGDDATSSRTPSSAPTPSRP